ncbi:MAG TPA: MMPL family transporter, partial [Gammaproteobacteria bacterium]|nr:MMPL family transporter [Gammaproteobacteria bacterium]
MLDTCGKALEAFVGQVIRVRWPVLVLALVLVPLGLRYAAQNLGINTDTANMISGELPWRESFDAYRSLFSVRDRNLLVVVESSDPAAAEDAARELAARMRGDPELFPSVFLAGDGEFFARNGLLYLGVDELERLSERLVDAQPLLGQIAVNPNGAGVASVLSQAIARADDTESRALLAEIEAAAAAVIDSAIDGTVQPLDWSAVLQAGSVTEQRQLVLVQPALDFSRMRPAREAIEQLRVWIGELEGTAAVPISARMTGTIAMEHEELDSVVRSAAVAGTLALIMVIAVLFWALRSLRLLLVSLSVLFFGLLGTAVFAAILVGHLNLLSVAFAVLYIGLGVDFILHINLRVRELLASGNDIDMAIRGAMQSIGASLVVCTLTTAAGFYAFVPSNLFSGISELGLISGTGMFVSFFVSVTLLPALLAIVYRSGHQQVRTRGGVRVTAFALRRARLVVAVTIVLVAAAAASLPRVYFDSNPVNLRDPSAESIVTLDELAADADADLLAMVAMFEDRARAASYIERFEALEEVREVRTVEALVPAEQ